MFQRQIINVSESMFSENISYAFVDHSMFQHQKYQCFSIDIFILHVVFDSFFLKHFFCSHRHDCGLYTMLYIESWNGKKMEAALRAVIAATYSSLFFLSLRLSFVSAFIFLNWMVFFYT
jgi:hypothetical protein